MNFVRNSLTFRRNVLIFNRILANLHSFSCNSIPFGVVIQLNCLNSMRFYPNSRYLAIHNQFIGFSQVIANRLMVPWVMVLFSWVMGLQLLSAQCLWSLGLWCCMAFQLQVSAIYSSFTHCLGSFTHSIRQLSISRCYLSLGPFYRNLRFLYLSAAI